MANVMSEQKKVVNAISRYVRVNNIRVGGRLPSIRAIAGDTGIAHATVAKAVKSLSEEGILVARNRSGTILAKDIGGQTDNVVQRIIMVNCVSNNNITGFVGDESAYLIRRGIKALLPKVELFTAWHTAEDDKDAIDDLLHYHYTLRGRPKNVVFLLGNAPRWVKKRFQDLEIPSIVLGGNEPGIHLPNVTQDTKHTVEEVVRAVDLANAYPAVLLVDVDLVIGFQADIIADFEEISKSKRNDNHDVATLRMSNVLEMFRSQLMQLLRSKNPPRTLIARGDETAIRAARVCSELGLLDKVGIISMSSSSLGEQFMPSLTGICGEPNKAAERIVRYAKKICNGEKVEGCSDEIENVMVFRESFKNPYLAQ